MGILQAIRCSTKPIKKFFRDQMQTRQRECMDVQYWGLVNRKIQHILLAEGRVFYSISWGSWAVAFVVCLVCQCKSFLRSTARRTIPSYGRISFQLRKHKLLLCQFKRRSRYQLPKPPTAIKVGTLTTKSGNHATRIYTIHNLYIHTTTVFAWNFASDIVVVTDDEPLHIRGQSLTQYQVIESKGQEQTMLRCEKEHAMSCDLLLQSKKILIASVNEETLDDEV